MKLTNFHRQAFVASVMNDVPKIDHQPKLQARVYKDIIETAPKKVADVFKDLALRHHVIDAYHSFHASVKKPSGQYASHGLSRVSVISGYKPSDEALADIEAICLAAEEQCTARNNMEQQVSGVIASCFTLKKAQELLPEFVKYLPQENVKGTMLPAIANLAADLVKMGWPKDSTAKDRI